MCLMAPARVLNVEGDACEVMMGTAVERVARLSIDGTLVPGDWVLVVAGQAVRRVEPEQAEAMQAALDPPPFFPTAAGDR